MKKEKASFSIKGFGVYLTVLGVILLLITGIVKPLLDYAEAAEGFVRFIGFLLMAYGYYYLQSVKKGIYEFFRSHGSYSTFGSNCYRYLSLERFTESHFFPLSLLDGICAIWTLMALKSDEK